VGPRYIIEIEQKTREGELMSSVGPINDPKQPKLTPHDASANQGNIDDSRARAADTLHASMVDSAEQVGQRGQNAAHHTGAGAEHKVEAEPLPQETFDYTAQYIKSKIAEAREQLGVAFAYLFLDPKPVFIENALQQALATFLQNKSTLVDDQKLPTHYKKDFMRILQAQLKDAVKLDDLERMFDDAVRKAAEKQGKKQPVSGQMLGAEDLAKAQEVIGNLGPGEGLEGYGKISKGIQDVALGSAESQANVFKQQIGVQAALGMNRNMWEMITLIPTHAAHIMTLVGSTAKQIVGDLGSLTAEWVKGTAEWVQKLGRGLATPAVQ